MPSTGDTIIGLALALLAGLCNSLWNVPFSPKLNVAVGKENTDRDLDHHYAWALFQVYGASINIPLCLYWAGGPERVSYIVNNSEALDISLVVIFSLLFGCGTLGFGIACKIAGVGMGTNLTIGLIMILGTFLPLVLDDIISTATGGVILAGLGVCSVGLYFAMKSLQLRDQDQAVSKDQPQGSSDIEKTEQGGEVSASSSEDGSDKAQPSLEQLGPSTFTKILVCTVAAVVATCLQFAFVFGQPIIDIAVGDEGPGSTPDSGAAAIVWLFVIPLCTVPSICYGLFKSQQSFQVVWQCPWWRHLAIVSTASIPWLGHIHLYGIANTFLPDHLSASVAWPVLLSSTVVLGMIWSVLLGEWKGASVPATKNLKIGFAFLFVGVCVVMSSAALDD